MKRLLLLLLLCGIKTSAQISIGPKIGMGLSTFRYTRLTVHTPYGANFVGPVVFKPIVTPQVGVVLNVDFWNVLSFRPELLYIQRGYTASYALRGYPMKETFRSSYLELPINLLVHGKIGEGRIESFAGVSLGYCLGGKRKTDIGGIVTETTMKGGKVPDNPPPNTEYINRWNFSLNFGLGYKYKQIAVQLAYNLGLSSLNPHFENKEYEGRRNYYIETKASSFNLGVTYFFDVKK
jgi:hypothetical protein